jgi:hypothetical protein
MIRYEKSILGKAGYYKSDSSLNRRILNFLRKMSNIIPEPGESEKYVKSITSCVGNQACECRKKRDEI